MSPAVFSAIFTFGGMVVAIITGWLGQRWRRRQEAKHERAQERSAIEQQLDGISSKLDEQQKQLNKIDGDVVYLKTRVAVHDDRWEFPWAARDGRGRF